MIDGKVLVWEQRDYLRHSSNLTEFASMLDETAELAELFPQSHMRKLLDVDIEHIKNLRFGKKSEFPRLSTQGNSRIHMNHY